MLTSRSRRLLAIVALLMQASCSGPTETIADLTVAKQRWDSGRPAAYDYTLRLSCFCGGETTRPVVIVVRGNTVESRNYADTGDAVPSQWYGTFPTIDGLFDVVVAAKARKADALDATYDKVLGYPLSISIDYAFNTADDEISYTVSAFHVR